MQDELITKAFLQSSNRRRHWLKVAMAFHNISSLNLTILGLGSWISLYLECGIISMDLIR